MCGWLNSTRAQKWSCSATVSMKSMPRVCLVWTQASQKQSCCTMRRCIWCSMRREQQRSNMPLILFWRVIASVFTAIEKFSIVRYRKVHDRKTKLWCECVFGWKRLHSDTLIMLCMHEILSKGMMLNQRHAYGSPRCSSASLTQYLIVWLLPP